MNVALRLQIKESEKEDLKVEASERYKHEKTPNEAEYHMLAVLDHLEALARHLGALRESPDDIRMQRVWVLEELISAALAIACGNC